MARISTQQFLTLDPSRFVSFAAGNVRDRQTGRVLPRTLSFAEGTALAQQVAAGRQAATSATAASQIAGGTVPGTTVETLPGSFEEAQARANAANEARNVEGRSIFDQMLANTQGFGTFSTEQAARANVRANEGDKARLIGRGLFNSTNLESLQRARQQDLNFTNLGINESVARSRNEILGNKVGFIERQFDQGPDPALFANLQSAASSAPTTTGGSISFSNPLATRTTGGSSSPSTDFAGRQVQSFGQLVRRNPGADRVTGRVVDVNERERARAAFADIGLNLGNRTSSQIQSILARAGTPINSADDVARLTTTQINRIQSILSGGSPGDLTRSESEIARGR